MLFRFEEIEKELRINALYRQASRVKYSVEPFIKAMLYVVLKHWGHEPARPSVRPQVGLSVVASGDSNQHHDVMN